MREIKIDFDNPGLPQRLDVVENDAQSRFFKAVLYKDGKAYTAPSGATYSIMYRGFGPQNEGWYDTINDGAGKRAACSVSGNVVTCEIARQALRVPGHVSVMLCVTGSNGYMLHGWPIDCNCRNDSYTGGTSVESFFYITKITNADWTSAIQTWEELKNTIDPTLSLSGKAADAAKVGEAVGQVKEDMVKLPSRLGFVRTLQRFDKNNVIDETSINGTTGTFQADTSYWISGMIPVDDDSNGFIISSDANGVFFYGNTGYLGRQKTVKANTPYTFPYENVKKLCFRFSKSFTPISIADDLIISFGDSLSETEKMYKNDECDKILDECDKIWDELKNDDISIRAYKSSIKNDVLSLTVPNIKKNNQISFSANVTSVGTLIISHGKTQPYSSGYVVITDTYLEVHGYTTEDKEYGKYEHGLAIKNEVSVVISVRENLTANIIIESNGQVFEKNDQVWNGNYGDVVAESINGNYTNCALSFGSQDFLKRLWIFGDSYVDMWPQILTKNGINNFMLDGFSGRNSEQAYKSFMEALKFGKPKCVGWFLGMNDRDGKIINGISDAKSVNQSWFSHYTQVKNYCDKNKITLILSTIPEVPDRDHHFKNSIIRNSGVRVVDVARAVGSFDVGSSWYDGMLATDKVHPSNPTGRNAIAYKMLSEIPEMKD